MANFIFQNTFSIGKDTTSYKCLSKDFVSEETIGGQKFLKVSPEAFKLLAKQAFTDVSFYLRTSHLQKVSAILEDPESSENDRFVAVTLLKNAAIAAKGALPSCQDTGTALVFAKKGHRVLTDGQDEKFLAHGIFETYQEKNLRYSQMAPLSMFEEKNTGTNLPAQIEIYVAEGGEYQFLFLAKGGGSANKSFLFQESKSLLNEKSLLKFVHEKLFSLGTAACPPYHIALVIGGTSAEGTLKAVKLASAGYYDGLPIKGNEHGQAFRDLEWEQKIFQLCQETRIGAQFGGKYLAHDVRVIRLPRHAASCPVGLGVSCSADRNIKGKITCEGIFLEQLEINPEKFLPKTEVHGQKPVPINLNLPMDKVLKQLSKHPVKTRLSLSGTLIVARDIAHARIKERLDQGKPMPDYFKNYAVYYAGPAKTPEGMPTGSFGPTTASRMDGYVEEFMRHGGSKIMLAKGNRSKVVTAACNKYGGFYLGSIGGPAAVLAAENILKMEALDFEDLGMEAIRKIEVKDFPAFIVCDDKGNNFFEQLSSFSKAEN